ncbi:type II toxin-antitoxin system YafQ family toxin [Bifidobacterium sp. ESL0790]|uniref:type II toxin-antitoxin system RelE/ParE family toxin n=1 Tax=Bifidobacterium sp. ESL0790 TaxID=2983233 RepID=UPI0023F83CF6|nr:type II toxin-antitoxin system YafQ family toxin [Bifidobacterium sp. ESL0790]WEV72796.1 type II toxin-antitoxin system YafQ family toxin [Bifidobacterium sp. ESL0790]
MYELSFSKEFLRDAKKLKKKHYDMGKLYEVFHVLERGDAETLRRKYRDHQLKGDLKAYRELHVEADWLLIYRVEENILLITLMRTGSHDQLLR